MERSSPHQQEQQSTADPRDLRRFPVLFVFLVLAAHVRERKLH